MAGSVGGKSSRQGPMASAIDCLDVRTWPGDLKAPAVLAAECIGGRAIERVSPRDGTLWIRVTGSQILFCLFFFSPSLSPFSCDCLRQLKAKQLALFAQLADAN